MSQLTVSQADVGPHAVVAGLDRERPRVETALGVASGSLAWREIRPGRFVTEVAAADDEAARATVRSLREQGISAVLGPPDRAHSVAWRNRNRPVRIDDRLAVCFPWVRCDAPITVEIDPGVGFGTGDHPSTVIVLQALAERIRGGEMVVDVGCGSGVLAVAATALGAAGAVGVDINEAGLVAARTNAVANGVAERTEFSTTPVEELQGRFDVVLANIHAPILAAMAGDLVRLMAPDGWLALSGLSPAQTSVVWAAIERASDRPLEVVAQPVLDEWAGLIIQPVHADGGSSAPNR